MPITARLRESPTAMSKSSTESSLARGIQSLEQACLDADLFCEQALLQGLGNHLQAVLDRAATFSEGPHGEGASGSDVRSPLSILRSQDSPAVLSAIIPPASREPEVDVMRTMKSQTTRATTAIPRTAERT